MRKAKVLFPHLLVLSREAAKAYLEDKENNELDGMVSEIYFRAAYGLEFVDMYEQMSKVFDIHGDC